MPSSVRRDLLRVGVVLRVLHLAEVGAVEELLEEHDLGALLRGVVGRLLVLLDHRFLVAGPLGLEQRATNDAGHGQSTSVCDSCAGKATATRKPLGRSDCQAPRLPNPRPPGPPCSNPIWFGVCLLVTRLLGLVLGPPGRLRPAEKGLPLYSNPPARGRFSPSGTRGESSPRGVFLWVVFFGWWAPRGGVGLRP